MTATQRLPGQARFKDGMARTDFLRENHQPARETTTWVDAKHWISSLNCGADL